MGKEEGEEKGERENTSENLISLGHETILIFLSSALNSFASIHVF